MPAVTPSSKSGTLITWLVVFVLFWVVGTVMAIYFYVDAKKARQDLDTSVSQYNEIIAKSDIDGSDENAVTALEVTATQTKDANFTLPQGTTLVGAIKALADAVVARETKIAQL